MIQYFTEILPPLVIFWGRIERIDPFGCQARIILKQVQLYSPRLQHPTGMIILIFPVHSAYGNAIKPICRLLSTPPGYTSNWIKLRFLILSSHPSPLGSDRHMGCNQIAVSSSGEYICKTDPTTGCRIFHVVRLTESRNCDGGAPEIRF